MAITAPEWLSKRGGEFKESSEGNTYLVLLNHQPLYMLTPVPVGGEHGCVIKQTNNGKLFPAPPKAATVDDALRNGLEGLRKGLGW
ncbi:hypothetical protein BH10PLA2_BH10PLA2_37660 [soil metagenome]